MRNSLLEFPILLACIWGGLAAGAASSPLRLPRQITQMQLRGRRMRFLTGALLIIPDVLAALVLTCGFCASLVFANGGEVRLYAVFGFALAAYLAGRVLRAIVFGK